MQFYFISLALFVGSCKINIWDIFDGNTDSYSKHMIFILSDKINGVYILFGFVVVLENFIYYYLFIIIAIFKIHNPRKSSAAHLTHNAERRDRREWESQMDPS